MTAIVIAIVAPMAIAAATGVMMAAIVKNTVPIGMEQIDMVLTAAVMTAMKHDVIMHLAIVAVTKVKITHLVKRKNIKNRIILFLNRISKINERKKDILNRGCLFYVLFFFNSEPSSIHSWQY
jgi:predicted peroxiredoxin